MAVTSSAMLNDGFTNVAKLLGNVSSPHMYVGIGVGNGTTPAAAGQGDLVGAEKHYEAADTVAYVADYKCKWESTFAYGDLTSHIFSEVVVCKDATDHDGYCLLRAVYDNETLGESDTLKITVTVTCQQGS